MFNKSIAISLAVLVTIFLAGCSNGNASSSSVPSTPLSSPEPAQSSSPEEMRTSLSTPEPSTASPSLVVEAASTGDTSVSITSDYVPAENTYSNHVEVSFTDNKTVETIEEYFNDLKESSIEITSRPEIGSYLFTVSISNDDGTTTYRFSSPQKDETLYCKDLSSSEWASMTGWIKISEAGAYDYIKSLVENSAAS